MTVKIINTTSPKAPESIFAERLRLYYEQHSYYEMSHIPQDSIWLGRKRLKGHAQLKLSHMTIQEEEYKGHQIVVVGFHREFQYYLNPTTLEHVNDYYQVPHSIVDTQVNETSVYIAFGYEIGNSENVLNIIYPDQFAVIRGTFETDSTSSTLKKAKKRIDLQAKIRDVRDELIQISDERFRVSSTALEEYSPYNALVGDKVFIHAHGRLRKGVIVDTTGSRFIVGYVTPSNHGELKFKTLPLSRLFVQEKV